MTTPETVADVLGSRARAYAAIDAVERDLRNAIEKYLLDHMELEVAMPSEAEELDRRRSADAGSDENSSLVDYLYTRQAYDILLRHSAALPNDLASVLQANVGSMDGFVSVRNRVMHGRPLQADDLEQTLSFVSRLVSRHFGTTSAVLAHLRADAGWQPAYEVKPAPLERVLHNLPIADFDETGLIGRSREVRALSDMLTRGRERMVTLTGEGGIGKTALALEACYTLVDQSDPPFEAVLWVSLKSERLTALGVQAIADAVRDVSGATEQLGRVLDPTFGGRLEELADYLSGVRALVVLDNLESAQGGEVVSFYDALPESVTFLFTSRVGIGEIERRIPLGGLSEADSVLLLRKFASRRGVAQLASLSPLAASECVARLRHSPLAIRWYVLSVESGRTPSDAIRNQQDLLRFCVENVLGGLTDEAALAVRVLRTLDRPISFDELAVLSDLEIDSLRRAAQALSQGSLVVRRPAVSSGHPDLLELSATARAYLPADSGDPVVLDGVMAREAAYLRDREERHHDSARRQVDANVVEIRTPEDEPVAHLLRLALQWGKRGDFDEARQRIARARALNPTYFEVDRVDAFLMSAQGQAALAVARYRDALGKCATDKERARSSHFLAGHLARRMHDVQAAIPLAELAHRELDLDDTASALGSLYIWDRRYEDGQQILLDLLDRTEIPKLRRIAATQLVASWRRWAEDELRELLPGSALEKAMTGAHSGLKVLHEGFHDRRLVGEVSEAARMAVRALGQVSPPTNSQIARLGAILTQVVADLRFRESGDYWRLEKQITDLPDGLRSALRLPAFVESQLSQSSRITSIVSRPVGNDETQVDGDDSKLLGTVFNLKPGFGFIQHNDYPQNVFFHAGSVADEGGFVAVSEGVAVWFSVEKGEDGRDRARDVRRVR